MSEKTLTDLLKENNSLTFTDIEEIPLSEAFDAYKFALQNPDKPYINSKE